MNPVDIQLDQTALSIARGQQLLSTDHLWMLVDRLNIDNMSARYRPGPATISGKVSERKLEIFRLAEAMWGRSAESWLELEAGWQQFARHLSKSKETGGKDNVEDVISAEILIRLVALASLAYSEGKNSGDSLIQEALLATNLMLMEACSKGRTRLFRVGDGSTFYAKLKENGLMIGSGGGKYLPCPEISLPYLFGLLDSRKINSLVYFW